MAPEDCARAMQQAGITICGGIGRDPAYKHPFQQHVKANSYEHDVSGHHQNSWHPSSLGTCKGSRGLRAMPAILDLYAGTAVTRRLATQSRRRRTLPSARRCGVLASRHAKAARSEHRLQAVGFGVGVVVGLAVLEFHQLQAVRSDDRDRRCSRSQAATFCLVANGQ